MLLRTLMALFSMLGLMQLVLLQIPAADKDGYLTVEQLVKRGAKALSWDRHYAMPIDFCIFPGLVALVIFFSAGQWTWANMVIAAGASAAVILLCVFFLWIGGTEAHVHDRKPTEAGIYHAVYAMVVVWAMIMILAFTPRPEPVLLMVLCIAVPAFFFVGTHMFLGMINSYGAASSFPGNPLGDPVGWSVLIAVSILVWARSYMLIPASFWSSIN